MAESQQVRREWAISTVVRLFTDADHDISNVLVGLDLAWSNARQRLAEFEQRRREDPNQMVMPPELVIETQDIYDLWLRRYKERVLERPSLEMLAPELNEAQLPAVQAVGDLVFVGMTSESVTLDHVREFERKLSKAQELQEASQLALRQWLGLVAPE